MPRRPLLLLALTACLFVATSAIACPNCKDTVGEDQQTVQKADLAPDSPNARPHNVAAPARLADGFNYSVLLMLVVPYTMLGGMLFAGYYFIRKNRAVMAAAQARALASAEAAAARSTDRGNAG